MYMMNSELLAHDYTNKFTFHVFCLLNHSCYVYTCPSKWQQYWTSILCERLWPCLVHVLPLPPMSLNLFVWVEPNELLQSSKFFIFFSRSQDEENFIPTLKKGSAAGASLLLASSMFICVVDWLCACVYYHAGVYQSSSNTDIQRLPVP